ncbi:IclR family transcriptional regulator [Streptomyces sp. NPDC016566]|uniref:IclR family transcriptional regulator n=1 Tax=Streptomyces sp. NPDC016566 TaxID=3364967 RepID=UPI0036FEB4E0
MALDRALGLLDILVTEARPLRLTELAQRTGMAKSTIHRMLRVLVAHHLVHRVGMEYEAGERMGAQVPGLLRMTAAPYLFDLYEKYRSTVCVGVLRGADVVYVERIHGQRSVRTPSWVTDRAPAHCTAAGKALLAHEADALRRVLPAGQALEARTARTMTAPAVLHQDLARVRAEGFALSRGEYVAGVACAAAPIVGHTGQPVAAIALGDSVSRLDPQRAGADVRRAAYVVSLALRCGSKETRHDTS